MFYSRLFAALSFLCFGLALAATLRLAIGQYAEWHEPGLAAKALRTAVALNPRDSAAWIALGLAAEQHGDMDQAAACFLQAEKVDRQYLPAWTSANFFFRRANDPQFWRAATRAAAMSYDDPAPLIELADRREPHAIAALIRLGDTPRMERGYLYFLIAQSRWPEAQLVAARLSSRRGTGDNEPGDARGNEPGDARGNAHGDNAPDDARDRELLLNFTDRLIAAHEGAAALALWQELEPAGRATNFNQKFHTQPSGHGFDWRVTDPPGGWARWAPSRLEFSLARSTPDACILLAQWVALERGRYRLQFAYRTEGLADETGLRWTLLHDARILASSPLLGPASNRRGAERTFQTANSDLYQLDLVYTRVPGTTHLEGRAEFALARLETQ